MAVSDLYHSGVVFALYTIGFLGVEWTHRKKALRDDTQLEAVLHIHLWSGRVHIWCLPNRWPKRTDPSVASTI